MTHATLAKAVGVSQSSVSYWESGRNEPSATAIAAISKALACDTIWLLTGNSSETHDNLDVISGQVRKIPLLSSTQAGSWLENQLSFEPEDAEAWMTTPIYVGPRAFFLRVQGLSMTAPSGRSIPPGSLALVDPDAEVKPNDIVIAALSDHSTTIKVFDVDGDTIHLVPLNPAFTPIAWQEGMTIVGRVMSASQTF